MSVLVSAKQEAQGMAPSPLLDEERQYMAVVASRKRASKMDISFLCDLAVERLSLESGVRPSVSKETVLGPRRKRFVCPKEGCTKSFLKESYLKDHIRFHSGDDPYECPFPGCNRRFKWRSSLSCHKRSHRRSEQRVEAMKAEKRKERSLSVN
eukprot:CAMPEP_0113962058 /NCGR_PEP_ID=MMETSP0011_2-20120614/5684_1 /TAXON_ID=101924 /ORGANISM="Rhodosorus marinus" /LENGTH=152 /DNA_ID=CAMNT_0000973829 /DNA_START=36 /DNA_END=494 /DNA_ORIENTATION=- /assembly_acc=CAM_ASM_000156